MTIRLSTHARTRLRDRVGLPRTDVNLAVRLPKNAFRRFNVGEHAPRTKLFATASALLVVHGRLVVTALLLSTERLADVLVRLLLGCWP